MTASEILEKINEALGNIAYPSQPTGLYEPIRYVLALGGKRIRPVCLLLAYNLYGDDVDKVMNAALGIETYHNYTLLHDDLMDKADVRRGKPTVHRKWDANTAILSGDSMLVLACRMILSVESPHCREVMSLFLKTALEIGEGQQYDMNFEKRTDVTEEEYIEMIRLKTSVLIACAAKMGAVLGNATSEDAELLYQFGEKIGLAFQIQDDFLDVYGNPSVFGKRIGGDIICNKKTFLLINALQRADIAQRAEIERWLSSERFDEQEKIQSVTNIYNVLGIRQLCIERIHQFFDEAGLCLDKVSVSDSKKQPLRAFAESLVNRKY